MSDPIQRPQELAYATPDRIGPSPLTAAVWISIVGLGLIVLGGCFLIGVMLASTMQSNSLFLAVMYLCAFGCFVGAVWNLVVGLGRLWSIARGVLGDCGEVKLSAMSDAPVPEPHPPTIDYETPRPLYLSEDRFRSWSILFISLFAGFLAAVFLLSAVENGVGQNALPVRLGMGAAGAAAAALSIFLIHGIITDRRSVFELTTAGIRHGQKWVPWSRVVWVSASRTIRSDRLRIYYGVGTANSHVVSGCQGTLSPAEYGALVQRLRNEVIPAYPHLQISDL